MGEDKEEGEGEVLAAHCACQSPNCEGKHLAKVFHLCPCLSKGRGYRTTHGQDPHSLGYAQN